MTKKLENGKNGKKLQSFKKHFCKKKNNSRLNVLLFTFFEPESCYFDVKLINFFRTFKFCKIELILSLRKDVLGWFFVYVSVNLDCKVLNGNHSLD